MSSARAIETRWRSLPDSSAPARGPPHVPQRAVQQREALGGPAAGAQHGLGLQVLDDPRGGLVVALAALGVGGGRRASGPDLDRGDDRGGDQRGKPQLPVERRRGQLSGRAGSRVAPGPSRPAWDRW
nr:hypothetical protein [Phytohabitans houttuyneae]